ncbi:hypothetical protein [Dictyobacter kobayashii]|uniref:hypothetical protein n=1 Tax=Dictyobacter kobayashii TaxID=2014872 RepID=UPI0013868823|nr:hypothetical protein [Dictyobacter kobayashii]
MLHANVAPATPLVRAGQPVALIYKNGLDPYYHVQNGTAIQDVYITSRWVTFGLITTWPDTSPQREIIYVCQASTIAQAAIESLGHAGNGCWSKSYPIQQPIIN